MNPDELATDLVARCRWARTRNDGRPKAAWSTGEQLAVAYVLKNQKHLDAMGYTPEEAAQRLHGDMQPPPSDFPAWVEDLRAAVAEYEQRRQLPTFQDVRREAYRLISDAQDVLRSDWPEGAGPSPEQAEALRCARRAIAEAKDALNEAAH